MDIDKGLDIYGLPKERAGLLNQVLSVMDGMHSILKTDHYMTVSKHFLNCLKKRISIIY